MKNTQICPKCQSTKVVYVESVRDDGGHSDFNNTFAIGTGRGILSMKNGRGELEVYCCRDCGYVEFYVKDLRDLDPERNGWVQEFEPEE
jgi:predicted nucleic-acid-binding Zn-ribbon protein